MQEKRRVRRIRGRRGGGEQWRTQAAGEVY
jgi:hypothetical protein